MRADGRVGLRADSLSGRGQGQRQQARSTYLLLRADLWCSVRPPLTTITMTTARAREGLMYRDIEIVLALPQLLESARIANRLPPTFDLGRVMVCINLPSASVSQVSDPPALFFLIEADILNVVQ